MSKSSKLVNTLITHGLDIISMLMSLPSSSSQQSNGENTLKKFLLDLAESMEKLSEGGTTSLLLLKTACEVLTAVLPDERNEIQVCEYSLLANK